MDSSCPFALPWNHRKNLLIAAAFAAFLAAPGVARCQEKAEKPASVANPNDEFTPKPFGRPLAVESEGKEIRTIFMYEGRSTADQRDSARIVYYHALDLALVPREKPLPGFP